MLSVVKLNVVAPKKHSSLFYLISNNHLSVGPGTERQTGLLVHLEAVGILSSLLSLLSPML